jgi:hypothetical protein
MTADTKRQEPLWTWVCKTCGRQMRGATDQHCGDFGKTIDVVPADLHRGAVSAEWAEQARGWLGLAQGAATPERAQEYIAKALDALGGPA